MGSNAQLPSLEDYPADLARALAELEQRRAEGGVDPERLLAVIGKARKAARKVDLRPWRRRGLWSGMAAVACLMVWEIGVIGFPDLAEDMGRWLDLTLALGLVALLRSVWCLAVYVQRRKAEQAWFDGLEATVRRGEALISYVQPTEGHSLGETASGF